MGENITKPAKRLNKRIALGKWGESLAADYMVEKGYQLVVTNFRTPDGEIDLVVQKDGELVFVEVKTRRNVRFGMPEEAVNDEKIDHLESAVGHYLLLHPEFENNWRLDVISVIGTPTGKIPQIDWFENVTG